MHLPGLRLPSTSSDLSVRACASSLAEGKQPMQRKTPSETGLDLTQSQAHADLRPTMSNINAKRREPTRRLYIHNPIPNPTMSSLTPTLSSVLTRARTHRITKRLHQTLLSALSYIHGILSAIFVPILHNPLTLDLRAHLGALLFRMIAYYKPRPRHFLAVLAAAVLSLLIVFFVLKTAAHITYERIEARSDAWSTLRKIMYGGNGILRVDGLG
ncbi:hypothetical protein BP6252_08425 [Coleophoma cylindrospora]|uniref:Uncharacterized protein n=1 Tax=Coleophoma cylindrospora TaxID=1849047 RepID=A0A3D8R5T0_9HELO|nr:hypothetical protein BP6252_08425 [Coleophoma cylindrospora]